MHLPAIHALTGCFEWDAAGVMTAAMTKWAEQQHTTDHIMPASSHLSQLDSKD